MSEEQKCPQCGSPLAEPNETPTGRRVQRCSKNVWNKETRKSEGCSYIKWLEIEPQTLDEKCPKCNSPLVLQVTRFGKKMKKCSAGGWDKEAKKATGCDYVEWLNGTIEKLNEKCPECGEDLVLATTANGKRLKKCSTAGWDREKRQATGCKYIEWLKPGASKPTTGEELLPPLSEE